MFIFPFRYLIRSEVKLGIVANEGFIHANVYCADSIEWTLMDVSM